MQRMQKAMYELRRCIRDPEKDVEKGLEEVQKEVGEGLESLLDEALQSKWPEDGQNVLLYAAAQGNQTWLLGLVDLIRSRVGIHALVKELRETDIDGVPLLFHAASSRRKHCCFRIAYDLVFTVLGKGGVIEQFEALDGLGRGILMHAARSNHVDTFKDVFDKCRKAAESVRLHDQSNAVANDGRIEIPEVPLYGFRGERPSDSTTQTPEKSSNSLLLREVLGTVDRKGMTCLHHAAEAGSSEVLCEVVKECGSHWADLGASDRSGRTPIMLVLRNAFCCEGEEHTCRQTDLEDKFGILFDEIPLEPIRATGGHRYIGWMQPSRIQPQRLPAPKQTPVETRAVTELIHAARGGVVSLELALNKALPNSKTDSEDGFKVHLDSALAVEVCIDGSWRQSQDDHHRTVIWGRALLLAAAARLGDVDVLYHVLVAIEDDEFFLEADDAGKFRLPERPIPVDETPTAIPVSNKLREVLGMINSRNVSLFSLAILSRRHEAVELIFDLVVRLFGEDQSSRNDQRAVRFRDGDDGDQGHQGQGQRDRGNQPHHDTIWSILTGHSHTTSSLTCAASVSMEADGNGRTMFCLVFEMLEKQFRRGVGEKKFRELLSPKSMTLKSSSTDQEHSISPLAGAVFSSNWVLFREVYDRYEKLAGCCWQRETVLKQIPQGPPHGRSVLKDEELHEYHDNIPPLITRGAWTIPAVMWPDIVKAYKRGEPDDREGYCCCGRQHQRLLSWRDDFKHYSRRGAKVAAKRGDFTALRELVNEGFPLHDDHMPFLLENIGDHEHDVIDTILAAVASTSNPFAMAAGVSRTLRMSKVDFPMHSEGLGRLQSIMDDFTSKVLEQLPQTVRGMGVALLGGHQPIVFGEGLEQGKRHRLTNLAGFIVVQWILEPNLLVGKINTQKKYAGPDYLDPLRRALDRGSEALDFLNTPLVKDYVHIKFACTLPSWTSRNPFQPTVNEGFFKYDDFDTYPLSEVFSAPDENLGSKDEESRGLKAALKEQFLTKSFLLRFLQGWDHRDSLLKWNIPIGDIRFASKKFKSDTRASNNAHDNAQDSTQDNSQDNAQDNAPGCCGGRFKSIIPSWLLCCNGNVSGNAANNAPDNARGDAHDSSAHGCCVGRFESIISSCRQPLWFNDKPKRWTIPHSTILPGLQFSLAGVLGKPETFYQVPAIRFVFEIFTYLYVFYDTWNFLDTSTIGCLLVTFVFRMIALDDDFFLFHAQFFYAASAPLLFSRLLVLSQIDATLGPMTQVIWRMISDTLRFSAFISVVMLSFALAFHAVFHTCGEFEDPTCNTNDDPDFPLRDAFGTFGRSFVTVFSAALGGPDFELYEAAGSECRCKLPDGAQEAGIFLMVVYMVIMAVVLLNLLIAVLSTAHSKVYDNGDKEFHLARAKLIYQSARVVTRRRPPPPLNLVKVVLGTLIDATTEPVRFRRWMVRNPPEDENEANPADGAGGGGGGGGGHENDAVEGEAEGDQGNIGGGSPGDCPIAGTPGDEFIAWTQTHEWRTFEGGVQRVLFAFTFGAAAIVMSAILWTLSVPWVAWCLLRLAHPVVEKRAENLEDEEDDTNQGLGDIEEEEEMKEKVHPGYFRRIFITFLWSAVLVVATAVAAILCALYILFSVVLWFVGLHMIYKWVRTNWTPESNDRPRAMPGQEEGDHWQRAWDLVSLRNHGVREDFDQAHFNVLPFLKSKTGLDRQHLAWLTKARDDKAKSEEDLIDGDRELPGARIDMEHLRKEAVGRNNGDGGKDSGDGGETKEAVGSGGGGGGAPSPEVQGGAVGDGVSGATSTAAAGSGGANEGTTPRAVAGGGAASPEVQGGAVGDGVSGATSTAAACCGGANESTTPSGASSPASTTSTSIAADAESGGPAVDKTSTAATLNDDKATGSGDTGGHDSAEHVQPSKGGPSSTLDGDTKMGPVRVTGSAAVVTTGSNGGRGGGGGDRGNARGTGAQPTTADDVAAESADDDDRLGDDGDLVDSDEELRRLEVMVRRLRDKWRKRRGKEGRNRQDR
ncbi:Transient Receptor Potential Channel. Partial sequence [Ectocarpus siliculosus]|uniref:Transient Receptor Potential Channel. Partial sequence n=1 Tax=Ectocarpus siliculosus TaxID=2880 RepID=D8LHA0_ECTSI|nr:Transient Receptor Potential Channel. Partial sequence [Ectocarpus siliculosus]